MSADDHLNCTKISYYDNHIMTLRNVYKKYIDKLWKSWFNIIRHNINLPEV